MTRPICVVHLIWAPLGTAPVERFAESYRDHPAGSDHRLVAILNGFDDGVDRAPWETALEGVEWEPLLTPAPMLDLAAYRFAAEHLDCDRICFLNSFTRLLADGWLTKLDRHLTQEGIGMVGAGGSYESLLSGAPLPLRLMRRRHFDPFPNPHLRSNAFLIPRDLMLDLDWRAVTSKNGAWRLESGKNSISRQIGERGLQALVVGRDGEAYEEQRWSASRTFRSANQENALVADNRTDQYAQADTAERTRLARLAWGPFADELLT